MPKIKESRYFKDSFLETQNLKSWFGKVVVGNDKVYDTPFAKGESTEELLSKWDRHLVSIKNKWPSLYEFEKDLADKVGPMSIELPLSERLGDIDHYYEDISLPQVPISSAAIEATINKFQGMRNLEVRNQWDTIQKMKKSTNSGSPYFTKRREVIDETYPVRVNHYKDEVTQILNGKGFNAAAILGWRGQEGGPTEEDVKQRVIWMFPFGINICELQVYQPFIEAAQKFDYVPAWVGMEDVDRAVTRLFDTKGKDDLIVCTDFSKFDQHFNATMQEAALKVLTAILSPSMTSKDWLQRVYPIKYMIPLAYNMDKVRFGRHGMASGSGGTNCDETIAHTALQFEAAQSVGALLNPNSQCLGDDGILSYPGITVEDVITAYTSHGLEMNADKQYASNQDCVYLRRWHHNNYRQDGICVGVYSTFRALGRMRYLERYMDPKWWDAKAVALRQLSILENVKYHPMRDEFVEFCMKRDKYRLGKDIPHFLDNIREVAKEKIDHMPDFLGYTKTLQSKDPLGGIENWWIIKYLKSK